MERKIVSDQSELVDLMKKEELLYEIFDASIPRIVPHSLQL
jgi:hypothetical protein